uniref:Coat protein n=1 Tax=Leviviridae sp. TaxID=2027243 RepID=A0A514D0C9_9VIRU|nr:MAG: hypothetical protein H2RhizoL493049e521_000002 [Leviviridae sp.]
MSFADPQSVTINAVANSLPRVSTGANTSTYRKDDGSVQLTVSHTYGKTSRRMIRLDHSKIALDPLTAENQRFSMSAYVVVDVPVNGYSIVEAKQVTDALTAYLTASTGANVTKLLGGES